MIYLDYNATTPVREAVIDAMAPWWREQFGNPQSQHAAGKTARRAVDHARGQLRAAVGAPDDWQVIFTGSGTESDNLALRGLLQPGDRLYTSPVEHKAVLAAIPASAQTQFLPVVADGRVDLDATSALPLEQARLVSLMAANNETGVIQPVAAIGDRLRGSPALLHCDAVQALGRVPLDVTRLGVALLSVSAHKIGGPKGVGALLHAPDLVLQPLIRGGSHENDTRAGTHNVPGIVGFGLAVELAVAELATYASRLAPLRDRLRDGVLSRLAWAVELAAAADRLPNTTMLAFPGCDTQTLLISLDERGLAAGAGAACSAGGVDPSHVTQAMGLPLAVQKSVVRFSLGSATTADDVEQAIAIVCDLAAREKSRRDDLRKQIYA